MIRAHTTAATLETTTTTAVVAVVVVVVAVVAVVGEDATMNLLAGITTAATVATATTTEATVAVTAEVATMIDATMTGGTKPPHPTRKQLIQERLSPFYPVEDWVKKRVVSLSSILFVIPFMYVKLYAVKRIHASLPDMRDCVLAAQSGCFFARLGGGSQSDSGQCNAGWLR